MMRLFQFWIGVLVSLVLVGITIQWLVGEFSFGLGAVSTTGTLEGYVVPRRQSKILQTVHRISGLGVGTVVFDVNGQQVRANFRSWYFYRVPRAGELVPVLYLPNEPGRVAVDSFMQRYGPLVFPLVLAFAAANWAGVFRLRRKPPIPKQYS